MSPVQHAASCRCERCRLLRFVEREVARNLALEAKIEDVLADAELELAPSSPEEPHARRCPACDQSAPLACLALGVALGRAYAVDIHYVTEQMCPRHRGPYVEAMFRVAQDLASEEPTR